MTGPPSVTPPVPVAQLRQLWERGRRADAIRGAVDHWTALVNGNDDVRWLVAALRSSGLSIEAFALQAQLAHRSAAPPHEWEVLIRSVLQSGDPWWARELLADAGAGSRELRRLRVETALILGDASELIDAWVREYDDDEGRAAAVDWWVRNGRIGQAERLVAQGEGLDVWRARFALWRRDPKAARAILTRLPPSAEARCLAAVATMQEGRLGEAESQLRALRDDEVQAEARSWLATVLRKRGRYADAVLAADAADMASPVFNLATRLERHLASELKFAATRQEPRSLFARVRQTLGFGRPRLRTIADLEHAAALYPLGVTPEDSIATLADVLERFAGNRTPYPTTIEGGTLRSYVVPRDPRHLGAGIQLVLWTRGAEAVRALYRELAPRVEGHPFFRIYQGEMELWLGNYEEAARIFRAVLDQDATTKWAWIGLGASSMLQGDLAEAQKVWEQGISTTGFAGPTLYVYRGECFRLQGDVPQARRELAIALQQKPERLSARINMALLEGEPDSLVRVEQACVAHAPILMEQLTGTVTERLEQVLQAMRGNRSSSPWHVSYHLWGRLWRRAV